MRRSIITLITLIAAGTAHAADPDAGRKVFERCKVCHTVEAGGETRLGPSLHGMFGRKAGSLPDFAYSAAMKNSNITWNDDTVARYAREPRDFIPGNRMGFPGIKNTEELENLVAYLREATQ